MVKVVFLRVKGEAGHFYVYVQALISLEIKACLMLYRKKLGVDKHVRKNKEKMGIIYCHVAHDRRNYSRMRDRDG